MNAISQAESLLIASAAMRTERTFAQPPEHPLQGGFTDAAAAQRGADRATAARLTYEARLERERKLRDRLLHQVAIARSEGRAVGATHALAQRQVGFHSGPHWGLGIGFPIGGAFFTALVWIGMHWKALA